MFSAEAHARQTLITKVGTKMTHFDEARQRVLQDMAISLEAEAQLAVFVLLRHTKDCIEVDIEDVF